MRYAISTIMAALLVGVFVPLAVSQPKIEIESPSFNFGVSYPNQFLQHDFIFWNKGDQPLEILKVNTTCGCAAAVLSATAILPSSSGIVSVTVATSAPRKKKETVTLTTNDPVQMRAVMEVETDVRNLWTLTPKSSFLFTEIPFETQQSAKLFLKNINNEPFKIKAITVKEPELTVETGEETPDGVPIIVTVKAKKEKKIVNDQVMVLTDHPKQPMVSIPVFTRIVGFIRFNRQRVFFGTMYPGEEKTVEVTAQLVDPNSKPDDLQILGISSDSKSITGKALGMRGDGQFRIELMYKAPETPGYQTGIILFKTNQAKEPNSDVPFSALVRPKP